MHVAVDQLKHMHAMCKDTALQSTSPAMMHACMRSQLEIMLFGFVLQGHVMHSAIKSLAEMQAACRCRHMLQLNSCCSLTALFDCSLAAHTQFLAGHEQLAINK